MQKTALYHKHIDLGAKMVPFAGFEMPVSYEGVKIEHQNVRGHLGVFDVSHMGQLYIYGNDQLLEDLEKIFPIDLKNLKLNHSKYSFLMNADAGIHDDLIVTKIEGGVIIILNAACKNSDFEILQKTLGKNCLLTRNIKYLTKTGEVFHLFVVEELSEGDYKKFTTEHTFVPRTSITI